MKSKKAIMGLAALLILVFHFYIPVTSWKYESLIAKISYIGVDMFFFVSAYSLGKSKITSYLEFLKRRFSKIYLKFIVFVAIAVLYSGYKLLRALKILVGIEFFNKGGGAFLWFVIAIMITYLFIPFAKKLKEKYDVKAFYILLAIWAIVATVLQYVFNYTTINIYINRLPIVFIGMFYDELFKRDTKGRVVIDAALLALGTVLLFRFGANARLNVPFTDFFYILAIPAVLALVDLVEVVYGIIDMKLLSFIGGITLELYGLQMIFGYKIETKILKLVGNGLVAFIVTTVVLTAMAYLFNKAYRLLEERVKK